MKIFDKDGKINFVDSNNVFVGYDLSQDCCEHADWFISDKKTLTSTEKLNQKYSDLEGYVFDTNHILNVDLKNSDGYDLDGGGCVEFRLTKGGEEKYLYIFNSQNGYYSHGFEVKIGDKIIKEEYI